MPMIATRTTRQSSRLLDKKVTTTNVKVTIDYVHTNNDINTTDHKQTKRIKQEILDEPTIPKIDDYKDEVKLSTSNLLDINTSSVKKAPEPDGYLDVDWDELDLERTLLGGQSFRWTKELSSDNYLVFTGIILEHVFKIWRISGNQVAFKKLNKNKNDKNPSINSSKDILTDYFQLKYNLKQLYKDWSKKDENLAKCCKQFYGFRILRQDPVENVFSFICSSNNNIVRISQLIAKLCKRYGDILNIIEDDDTQCIYDSYHSFPPIERLAKDDVFECLRYELGFGYRAKFISETAKQLVELVETAKHKDLEAKQIFKSPRQYLLSLRALSYKETCKRLMSFPGIGRKVADCICLMSMDHLNSVPIDCHIYNIVCRNYMPNLRQERKTLTESVHDMIGDYFNKLHGDLAGWSTSVLFIAELKHLKIKVETCDTDDAKKSKHSRSSKGKKM